MSDVVAPAPPAGLEPRADSPKLSVVIPTYQAAATIAAAVGSALGQTEPPHEVIVVDDGSTDAIDAALEAFSGRIIVVKKENGGSASALNAGARRATGEFMVILDADDSYHPRRLEAIAQLACSRPDLDLITTDAHFVVDGQPRGRFAEANPFAASGQRRAILKTCFVGGWPAVRLARLNQVGGFDEGLRIAHDWDCWVRLIFDGCRAGLVDEPYYNYSLHGGGTSANRAASLRERMRLLEKVRQNPTLEPEERREVMAQLRLQRTRAILVETEAVLAGRPGRLGLLRSAVGQGIGLRTRLIVGLAVVAPPLARRLIEPDTPLTERFRDTGPA